MIRKAKTAKGRRIIEDREAKLVETGRTILITRYQKSSPETTQFSKEFYDMLKPNAILRLRGKSSVKNSPFENATEIEIQCAKTNTKGFILGSNSKKRRNNVVFGRLFEDSIFDMVEVGISEFKSRAEYNSKLQPRLSSAPILLFKGDEFENTEAFKLFKNMMTDFLVGPTLEEINIRDIDHSYVFTALSPKEVLMTAYSLKILASKSEKAYIEAGENALKGRISSEAVEIGPRVKFEIRRIMDSPQELEKEAFPDTGKKRKRTQKNIEHDEMGIKYGRIHMEKQDLDIGGKRMKVLKKSDAIRKRRDQEMR